MSIFSKSETKQPATLGDKLVELQAARAAKLEARNALLFDAAAPGAPDASAALDALDAEIRALDISIGRTLEAQALVEEQNKKAAELEAVRERKRKTTALQKAIDQANRSAEQSEKLFRDALDALGDWRRHSRNLATIAGLRHDQWPLNDLGDAPLLEVIRAAAPAGSRLRSVCPARMDGSTPPDFAPLVAQRNQNIYDNFMKGNSND
jgi:hypothetical protein